MKWFLFAVLLIGIGLAILALPFVFVELNQDFTKYSTIQDLLRLYLTTVAFVGALWAVYLKDNRLRAISENVLVALIIFIASLVAAVFAVLFESFSNHDWAKKPKEVSLSLSLALYIIALAILLLTVFVQTYNQVYNLRTNKFYKYFKPFRWLRYQFGFFKHYESTMETRTIDLATCPLLGVLAQNPGRPIKDGATILITGKLTQTCTKQIISWVVQRLASGETANYVVSDRHPKEIWSLFKADANWQDRMRKDLVLIDAYSPAFAFTDDIHEEQDREIKREGGTIMKAKTFAGLHTATNLAFNIIKEKEQQQQKQTRRPSVMVYANTSALCELESSEQFRVFWRHVIPSERSYGMISLIVEHELVSKDTLDPLRQLVDYTLKATKENGTETFTFKEGE